MAGEAEVPKVSGVARKIGTVGVGQFLPGSTAFRIGPIKLQILSFIHRISCIYRRGRSIALHLDFK